MKERFTIVVFTENEIGLVNRITSLFIQRHINIESITASESEYKNIHRFTIVIHETEELTIKVVKQIEKQVDVLKAFHFTDENTIYCEIALYKIRRTDNADDKLLNQVIKSHNAFIREIFGEFIIIEKIGKKEETHALFNALEHFEIQGFARSGRVSLSKTHSTFSKHLTDLEAQSTKKID